MGGVTAVAMQGDRCEIPFRRSCEVAKCKIGCPDDKYMPSALFLFPGTQLNCVTVFCIFNGNLDGCSGENGYTEVSVPLLVTRSSLEGTGQLPKFEEDLFKTNHLVANEDSFLIPTGEVPLTNLLRGQLLDKSQVWGRVRFAVARTSEHQCCGLLKSCQLLCISPCRPRFPHVFSGPRAFLQRRSLPEGCLTNHQYGEVRHTLPPVCNRTCRSYRRPKRTT